MKVHKTLLYLIMETKFKFILIDSLKIVNDAQDLTEFDI